MFGWIARAAAWAGARFSPTIANWTHDVVAGLYGFLRGIFGAVITAWNYFYVSVKLLLSGLEDIFDKIGLAFEYLWKHFIPGLFKWINTNIVAPLLSVVHWVTHEGAVIWNYISHPDLLAQYLFSHLVKELERLAWETGKTLGTFFLALIIHNLRRFVILIEDIVNAVF